MIIKSKNINITDDELFKPHHILKWYDRHEKTWVIQRL